MNAKNLKILKVCIKLIQLKYCVPVIKPTKQYNLINMNSSGSQHFLTATSSTFKAASSLAEVCRLRNNLNDDCLLKMFEYLNVKDLIQLCKLDSYFYDLITSDFIPKKLINLGVMDTRLRNNKLVLKRSTIEYFKVFGKFMKRIVISGEDFNLFLDTIVRYCQPDRLTEINLQFKENTAFPALDLIDQSLPFFTRLHRLRLYDISSNGLYQQFLIKISEISNVQFLQLRQVNVEDGWLQRMDSLRELQIHSSRILSFDDLSSCYKVNPKLRVFNYKGSDDLQPIYDTLSACCPNLQTFSDCHLQYLGHVDDVEGRYKFLSPLKQLENVTLTSYSETGHDLHHHLRIPALANISKLGVHTSFEERTVLSKEKRAHIMESFSVKFENLKTIEMEVRGIYDKPCDLRCEFIFNLVSRLENIENIKFIGHSLVNVNRVLYNSMKIRRLCIADADFRSEHYTQELKNIVLASRRVPMVHLQVSQQQWNELQTYAIVKRTRHMRFSIQNKL